MEEHAAKQLADLVRGNDKTIIIHRNHGVTILANSIEEAFTMGYYVEIVSLTQIQALIYSKVSGLELNRIPLQVVKDTAKKLQGQAQRLFSHFVFEGFRKALNNNKI